jgi:hypothetical protein
LFEYLKRNIRLAAKSVFFHYKQYLCFFCAVFVIQLLYGIVTVAFDNYGNIEYGHILEEYDYHLLLKDLNIEQHIFLINGAGAVYTSDKIFEIIKVVERDEPGSHDRKYDYYLRFTGGDLRADYNYFKERFGKELAGLNPEGLRYSPSPVISFDTYQARNTAVYLGVTLLITLTSVFLLTALYYIRLNHYKFTYAIYMTFGADFRKLFETSFWEMMTVSAAVLPVSSVISAVINYAIFASRGEPFLFHPSAILKTAVFSLIVSAFAVVWPIWRVSRRHPVSLIAAEDNSNLVISPRMSFEFYGASFPLKYEFFSLWRFRRYYLQLFATAVVFAALFVCSFVWKQYYTQQLEHEKPHFAALFTGSGYTYTNDMKDELYAIDGVSRIEKRLGITAPEINSHILIPAENTTLFSNLVVYKNSAGSNINPDLPDPDGLCVTNDIAYLPCDADVASMLEKYKHTGDLASAAAGERKVIISDSINNSRVFKLMPGDRIYIAVLRDKIRDVDAMLSGRELLKSQLRYFIFEYYEFTVGAVLKNDPTYDRASVYMSDEDFKTITGSAAAYNAAQIYIGRGLEYDKIRAVEDALREWAEIYGAKITNNHTAGKYAAEYGCGNTPRIAVAGLLILAISPLIWFFSQVIFCLKRENEFYVIEMMGAVISDVRRVYIIDGIFAAAASSLVYIFFCLTGSTGIYKLMNNVAARLFNDFSVRYMFSLPALPFVTGLVLTAACGFLSAYLPYLIYRKKRGIHMISEDI